jgi:hypothetical protein
MDIEQLWEKAKNRTEIIRGRIKGLDTFKETAVPYIFLSESSVNEGNTVIRKGKIIVEKPMIFLPEDMPQFEGFDFEKEMELSQELVQTFFLMRGIRLPSLRYNNTVYQLDLDERKLSESVNAHKKKLEKAENVNTALVIGPEEAWQFSLLLYIAALAGRCARTDIMNIFNKMQDRK